MVNLHVRQVEHPAQYPYRLEKLVDGGNVRDANGNYVMQPERWELICMCRDEVGSGVQTGASRKATLEDGSEIRQSTAIYCPLLDFDIPDDTQIRIVGLRGEVRVSGRTVYQRNGVFHTQVWI